MAELHKHTFLNLLKTEIFEKEGIAKLVKPYEDIFQNNELIKIPEYSKFIFSYRSLLTEAEKYFKKTVELIKGNCLLFENDFKVE